MKFCIMDIKYFYTRNLDKLQKKKQQTYFYQKNMFKTQKNGYLFVLKYYLEVYVLFYDVSVRTISQN